MFKLFLKFTFILLFIIYIIFPSFNSTKVITKIKKRVPYTFFYSILYMYDGKRL